MSSHAYVALSLTVTGLDPRRDRVQHIAAVDVRPSGARSEYQAAVSQASGRRHAGGVAAPAGRRWADIASELRELLDGKIVVVRDAESALAVLAAEGVRLA
ncbi:MAG: hypothetical protein KC442_08200, partial [Thermomicrobiales bacterium]|nr:hypothetical protein [Thermomicrobiales bacterium]